MNSCFRLISIYCLLTAISVTAPAQDNSLLLNKLAAPDGPGGSRVTVTESGESASILRMAGSTRRNSTISAYRVRIFFDNSQNARSNAYATLNRFREIYPEIPVDLKYDVPYFRVTAGYCLTKEEAIILWGRIKDTFPKAFLIPEPENISLETFLRYGTAGVDEPEPTDVQVGETAL
ncbi:MAG: hypothetical protein LIO85_06955 [Rikenellaceae bacterium]|nr:hypothetical protein [Rikenellaceae bacterium]